MAMDERFVRTKRVLGEQALDILKEKRVAVFGIGGVGGNCAEALARSGVGHLDLIDSDDVSTTNINRQLFALSDTVGRKKVDVAEERLKQIHPEIEIVKYPMFYLPENRDQFDFTKWDYIVDAIDTVSAKLDIIQQAEKLHIPVISAMGCGNRTDPFQLTCTDIYKTKNDPLAKVMRHELKKRGIRRLTVVYSTELPRKPIEIGDEKLPQGKRSIPGSTAFVPPCAGIMIASKVVMDLVS